MARQIHRRLLGADRGVPLRRVHGRPAGRECCRPSGPRAVRARDLAQRLEAGCPARAKLAFTVLARIRHSGVEQRGRAVASGGLGVL